AHGIDVGLELLNPLALYGLALCALDQPLEHTAQVDHRDHRLRRRRTTHPRCAHGKSDRQRGDRGGDAADRGGLQHSHDSYLRISLSKGGPQIWGARRGIGPDDTRRTADREERARFGPAVCSTACYWKGKSMLKEKTRSSSPCCLTIGKPKSNASGAGPKTCGM